MISFEQPRSSGGWQVRYRYWSRKLAFIQKHDWLTAIQRNLKIGSNRSMPLTSHGNYSLWTDSDLKVFVLQFKFASRHKCLDKRPQKIQSNFWLYPFQTAAVPHSPLKHPIQKNICSVCKNFLLTPPSKIYQNCMINRSAIVAKGRAWIL